MLKEVLKNFFFLGAVVLNWIDLVYYLVTLVSVDFLFFLSGAIESRDHKISVEINSSL